MNHKKLYVLVATFLVLGLTMLVYWAGLNGPFLLDDQPNLLISYVEQTGWDTFKYTVFHNDSGMLGRSVSMISFVITSLFYGIDPWGYKFHNLLVHLLIGLGFFRLFWRILPALGRRPADNNTLWIAGLTASAWLLHPLLLSTVLYPVQRMTQLSTLFTLAALLVYVEVRMTVRWRRSTWLAAWALFPMALLLALLSKETGALIPLFMLMMEVLVFRTSIADLRKSRALAVFMLVFVAIPLVVGTLVVFTHPDTFINYSFRTFTLSERLMTELHVMVLYLQLILLPQLSQMSLYHDNFPLTTAMDLATAGLLLVLLLVLAVIWFGRNRTPVLGFGLAWFLVAHLMESTFIPLELVFEHRNYLPAAGLLLILVYYLFQAPGMKQLPLLLVLIVPGLSLMTYSRAREWSDERVMLAVAVNDHPDSARLRTEYANFLFNASQINTAIEQLERASELQPRDPGPLIHQLIYKCSIEQQDPGLLMRARDSLAVNPASTYTLNALGLFLVVLTEQKCAALSKRDAADLINAAMSQPANTRLPDTMAYLLRFKGMTEFLERRYAQGVIDYRSAFELSGNMTMLAELFRYQLNFKLLPDAVDTLNLIRAENANRFGVETHQIRLLEEMLQEARENPITDVSGAAPD